MKGFATFIPDDVRCASACAIAWLGGTQRFAGPRAAICFHAAAWGQTGAESGMGNALLGSYLNQIGLPEMAIAYITVSAPQSMTWLNFEAARKVGIEVTPYSLPSDRAAPGSRSGPTTHVPVPQVEAVTFEGKTKDFVAGICATWPGLVPENYPQNVSYYGKVVSRDEVLADKSEFISRWPDRRYAMQSASASCKKTDTGPVCDDVTAQVTWRVANGAKSASGTMALTYRVLWWSNQYPKILAETSETVRDPVTSYQDGITSWFKEIFRN
jgi:hypothetical protein